MSGKGHRGLDSQEWVCSRAKTGTIRIYRLGTRQYAIHC